MRAATALLIDQTNTATTAMDITIDDLDVDAATLAGMTVTANDNNTFAMRLTNSDLAKRMSS